MQRRRPSYLTAACSVDNASMGEGAKSPADPSITRSPALHVSPALFSMNAGTFVPKNFRSQEQKFHRVELSLLGTKVPWNFRSLELSLPGTKVPWNFRSLERSLSEHY